jgi:protein-tyrosine-phosphatase
VADRPFNVLFLCTGNSARSIIAETILNKVGAGRFCAYSAGSQPKGRVNPHTIQLLQGLGYDTWASARSRGANSPSPARPHSISFSLSVTTPRERPARYGRASR